MTMHLDGITRAPEWHPLHLIDEYLFSRGWVLQPAEQRDAFAGWVPPPIMQKAVQLRYGGGEGGHWTRAIAISMQVSYDQEFAFTQVELVDDN
jgi:hypothetical protein